MQANWIITSSPEKVKDKVAATGLQTWEISAWADMAGDPARHQALILSDFPAAEQQEEQAAAFAGSLREFVQNGGCLTALDGSTSLLTMAFPEKVTGIRWLETGQAALTVTDPALAQIAGEHLLPGLTAPLAVPQAQPEDLRVFIQLDAREPVPVVFAFEFGNGLVLCQPILQSSMERYDTLLEFLTAAAQSLPFRLGMLDKAKKERALIAAEYPLLLSAESPVSSVCFTPPQGKSALVLLYWQGNARMHLHIKDELGRIALNHTRESSPFAWYSPMPGGTWHCKAELVESQDGVLPALLACCNIDPPSRRKFPQGTPAGPARIRRCPKCKMPLNPTMKFCPACSRKVDEPTPR